MDDGEPTNEVLYFLVTQINNFIFFSFQEEEEEEEEEEEGTEEIAIHLQNVVGTIALETRLDLVIFFIITTL